MGRACELMANPHSAQLHFMQALQLIEGSSDDEKARMGYDYEIGKFALRMDFEAAWLQSLLLLHC